MCLADTPVNSNYNFVPETKLYDISKAQVSITWTESLIYNGEIQRPTAGITSVVYDDLFLSYSGYSGIDAGTDYFITVDVDNANYEIVDTPSYSILPQNLSAVWENDILYYDGTVQHHNAAVSGIIKTENVTFTYADFENNNGVSASYRVTLALVQYNEVNKNYKFDSTATHVYAVLPKPITINNVVAVARGFDETTLIDLTDGELCGLIESDSVSFTLGNGIITSAYPEKHKQVATNIMLSGKDAYKYTLTQPTLTVSINKLVADMNGVKFQDSIFTYDGNAKSINILGELPNGVNVLYEGNAKTVVGEYVVTAIFDGGQIYEPIPNMTANLYIAPSRLEYGGAFIDVVSGYVDYEASLEIVKSTQENENYEAAYFYDIKIIKNGNEIQPNGEIKVSLPLDGLSNLNRLHLMLVGSDGSLTEIESQIEGNYLVFYTEQLSMYAVIMYKPFAWWWIVLGLIIFGVCAIIILLIHHLYRRGYKIAKDVLAHRQKFDKPFTFCGLQCNSFASFVVSMHYESQKSKQDICMLSTQEKEFKKLVKITGNYIVYWHGECFNKNSQKYITVLKQALTEQKEQNARKKH